MSYNDLQYEETIDLKDLCIFILRKWKLLLIAAVLGAVVLGSYKVVWTPDPAVDTSSASVQETQKKIKANEKTISANQKTIIRNRAEIEDQEASIAALNDISSTYELALNEAKTLLETMTETEARVELISQIAALNDSILDSNSQIAAAKQQILELTDGIASLQENCETLEAENESLRESLEAVPAGAGDVIKYAVLGAIAGILVVCVIAFLQYFFYQKLRNGDELKERYGLRVLGNLNTPAVGKSAFDRLLDRAAGYRRVPVEENEYALAAAGIRVLSEEWNSEAEEKRQILVTGTLEKKEIDHVCHSLREYLPDEQYRLCAAANPVYHADSMLQIRQSIIVLAEAKDVSDRQEIQRLMELLRAAKADIVGVIML